MRVQRGLSRATLHLICASRSSCTPLRACSALSFVQRRGERDRAGPGAAVCLLVRLILRTLLGPRAEPLAAFVEREDGTLVNYYSLLGLKRSATREDVKTAYRQAR